MGRYDFCFIVEKELEDFFSFKVKRDQMRDDFLMVFVKIQLEENGILILEGIVEIEVMYLVIIREEKVVQW